MASFRYYFEHLLFPDLFYHYPLEIMKNLEATGSRYIVDLWENCLENMSGFDDAKEWLSTVSISDFEVQIGEIDDLMYEIIRMPKTTTGLQCAFIGLVFSHDGNYYYTAERMEIGDFILCGWSLIEGELLHNNYCMIAKNEEVISEMMIHKILSPKKDFKEENYTVLETE